MVHKSTRVSQFGCHKNRNCWRVIIDHFYRSSIAFLCHACFFFVFYSLILYHTLNSYLIRQTKIVCFCTLDKSLRIVFAYVSSSLAYFETQNSSTINSHMKNCNLEHTFGTLTGRYDLNELDESEKDNNDLFRYFLLRIQYFVLTF